MRKVGQGRMPSTLHSRRREYTSTTVLRALQQVETFRSSRGSIPVAAFGAGLSSVGGGGAEDVSGRGHVNSIAMLCMSPGLSESLFFKHGALSYCRLCQEDTEAGPRNHIINPERKSHLNHGNREVVLDSLALLAMRGYIPRNPVEVWATLLHRHREIPRIHSLSDPRLPVHERAKQLQPILRILHQLGVLDLSINVVGSTSNEFLQSRRRQAFERVEVIGDNSWGTNFSSRMMILFPDRQWMYSQNHAGFNLMRDATEMNSNLENVFDFLDIASLMTETQRTAIVAGKVKADVIEAMMGELHLHVYGFEPGLYDKDLFVEINGEWEAGVLALVKHTLSELYDLMFLYFVGEMVTTAQPLAMEVASGHCWDTNRPQLQRARDRVAATQYRKQTANGTLVSLPPPLELHPAPTVRPQWSSHDTSGLEVRKAPPATTTTNSFTGTDVFVDIIRTVTTLEEEDQAAGLDAFCASPWVPTSCAPQWGELGSSLQLSVDTSGRDDAVLSRSSMSLSLADQSEIYFRDPLLNLESSPQERKSALRAAESTSENPAELVLGETPVYPYLASAAAVEASAEGIASGTCPFTASVWVPDGVKPPSAGVITGNNLHWGQFVFQHDASAGTSGGGSEDGDGKSSEVSSGGSQSDVMARGEAHRLRWSSANPYFAEKKVGF